MDIDATAADAQTEDQQNSFSNACCLHGQAHTVQKNEKKNKMGIGPMCNLASTTSLKVYTASPTKSFRKLFCFYHNLCFVSLAMFVRP